MSSLVPIRGKRQEENLASENGYKDGENYCDDGEDEPQMSEIVKERAHKFVVRFLKGFGSGLVVFSGVKIVTALMRNPFRESLPKIRAELLAKDGVQFATFLGLFPSIYDLVVELLEEYRGCRDDINSAVAGGIAGLAMVVEDRTRRRMYCLFAIARAFGAILSTLVKRGYLPTVPYSETAMFSLGTGFLVYCTALNPQYLFTGYYRSILKWSRDYTDSKLNTLFRDPGSKFLTCADVGLHQDTCTYHAMKDLVLSVPTFAKLYLPIHIAPVIFFQSKQFFRRPKHVILRITRNTITSTAFLASMVMLAKYVICLLRDLRHKPPPLPSWIPMAAGMVAGLGVLFERVNRRRELCLFIIPHTLYAVYLWAKDIGIVRHIPNSSIILYALAMVPIMHAYEREPESLNLLLHSALKFFVGKRQSTVERKKRTVSEMSI